MLEYMVAARVYSTRIFNLQRQGRAGTNAPVDGAEAAVVGTAHALDPTTDWVLPQYREPVALSRYGNEVIRRHLFYVLGHPAGGHLPDPLKVWPPQISLAAQLPHATGLAWGMQLRGDPGVVAVFFGDGASSEGDFYEACNLAGVLAAPVLFICVNNGWAISTPVSKQTGAASFADKADAVGFPGIQVDGTDVVAVHEAARAARARAVAGGGPTLIECTTYRLGPHTTADDPTRYVPAEEIAAARLRDPIVVFRRQLEERGLWDDERQADAEGRADVTMDGFVAEGEALELEPDEFFDHVFAEPTERQQRQRATMRHELGLSDV
jgi:pyruvate dehydrogenase E1 component alpha subunit